MTGTKNPDRPAESDDAVDVGVPADDGSPDDPTVKELLLDEDAEYALSPDAAARLRAAPSPTMRLIAKQQARVGFNALKALERSGALRNIKVSQNALASLNTPRIRIAALDNFKINPVISDGLREQIAASIPTAKLGAQFAPLQAHIAKTVLPKLDLPVPKIPTAAFGKLYGREFAPIATKLVNIQKLFDGVDFERVFAAWYPQNWDRERGVEQYQRFIELADNEGLPLTWVPNTELTYLLADAETPEERATLLVEHGPAIVADCREVLDAFDTDTHLVAALRTALDAYEAGFHEPAQAHAASILDTALREVFVPKRWTYPNVKKLLHTGKDWESIALRSARLLPTSVALRGMLEDFYTDRGDAIPRRPNRHASAHAVHPDQYNPVNAIKFLMLATAMLAEMEYDGWARILAETAA